MYRICISVPFLCKESTEYFFDMSDIDECHDSPDICGVNSTCINLQSTLFYDCDCKPGTRSNNGDTSQLQLTCVGKPTIMHVYHSF